MMDSSVGVDERTRPGRMAGLRVATPDRESSRRAVYREAIRRSDGRSAVRPLGSSTRRAEHAHHHSVGCAREEEVVRHDAAQLLGGGERVNHFVCDLRAHRDLLADRAEMSVRLRRVW
jgi:hypothetical protein